MVRYSSLNASRNLQLKDKSALLSMRPEVGPTTDQNHRRPGPSRSCGASAPEGPLGADVSTETCKLDPPTVEEEPDRRCDPARPGGVAVL